MTVEGASCWALASLLEDAADASPSPALAALAAHSSSGRFCAISTPFPPSIDPAAACSRTPRVARPPCPRSYTRRSPARRRASCTREAARARRALERAQRLPHGVVPRAPRDDVAGGEVVLRAVEGDADRGAGGPVEELAVDERELVRRAVAVAAEDLIVPLGEYEVAVGEDERLRGLLPEVRVHVREVGDPVLVRGGGPLFRRERGLERTRHGIGPGAPAGGGCWPSSYPSSSSSRHPPRPGCPRGGPCARRPRARRRGVRATRAHSGCVRRAPSPTLAEDGAGAATRSASGRADRADDDARRAGDDARGTRRERDGGERRHDERTAEGRREPSASRARAVRDEARTTAARARVREQDETKNTGDDDARRVATTRVASDRTRNRPSVTARRGCHLSAPCRRFMCERARLRFFVEIRTIRRNTIPPPYVYHTSPPRRSDGSSPLSPPSPSPARPRARRSRAWPDRSPPRRSPTSSPRPPPRA